MVFTACSVHDEWKYTKPTQDEDLQQRFKEDSARCQQEMHRYAKAYQKNMYYSCMGASGWTPQ